MLHTDSHDRALLQAAVERVLADSERALRDVGPEVEPIFAAARAACRGGKMLRGLLSIAAWEACVGQEATAAEPVVGIAAALELFQAAALVHDDVMDASDTRRGSPSAHRQLETAHPGRPTSGGRARFGELGAILLGDYLLNLSAATLTAAASPLPSARQVQELFALMTSEVTLGQFLDLYASHAPSDAAVDLDRAERVIVAKAAHYSVQHPLALGAIAAGAGDDVVDWFHRLGSPVGAAFQLRDDILGVFGDPLVTGKPAGDDLREGKRTVLLTLGLAWAEPAGAERLAQIAGAADITADDVSDACEILTVSGARDAVEARIAEHVRAGRDALSNVPQGLADITRISELIGAAVARVS